MRPFFEDDARFAALSREVVKWNDTRCVPRVTAKPGVGADCVRFVEAVLRNVGAITPVRFPRYLPRGGGNKTMVTLFEVMDNIPEMTLAWTALQGGRPELVRGDVLIVSVKELSWHMLLLMTPPTVWHCYDRVKQANLHDPSLAANLKAVYRVVHHEPTSDRSRETVGAGEDHRGQEPQA